MLKFTSAEFARSKREKLLSYEIYSENFDEASATIEEIRAQLQQPASVLEKTPLSAFLEVTSGLAWESTEFLANTYSAGHPISDLRSFYPTVIECWETFAKYATAYGNSEKGRDTFVAHLPLQGSGYHDANRLVCFAILLGWPNLLERLVPIIDHNNPTRDGLLERLIAPYVARRGEAPDDCTRHLPYFKTLKVFNAPPDQRPQMMAKYLDDWYHASRREPYYDSHEKGTSFVGYWSWEAAAVTFILDIEDTEYRNASFYPADLVQFARANRDENIVHNAKRAEDGLLRAKSGDICPLTGRWETLNKPVQSMIFKTGEVITDAISAYGLTVWLYKGEN